MRTVQEYDIVYANKLINDKVPKGTKGTVLIIYEDDPLHYEVEFVDEHGGTLDILTVAAGDIIKKIN